MFVNDVVDVVCTTEPFTFHTYVRLTVSVVSASVFVAVAVNVVLLDDEVDLVHGQLLALRMPVLSGEVLKRVFMVVSRHSLRGCCA